MDIPTLGEENLEKEWSKTKKNGRCALTKSYGERKVRKLFEKVFDLSEKLVFKKHLIRFSIDRKSVLIDQNRQRLL